ncbi:MAG TPA: hypothetical protein VLV86_22960, partial [Vicinamibacterales bacterium]|nr:hypothetical protein [Vicinamibacterales bacterium]
MLLPNLDTVEGVLARFNDDLNTAQTAHDRQAVRDRYLGRKSSVLAEWMERLAAAPAAEKRHLGQLTNALKKELEARWTQRVSEVAALAPPADAVDVTLPGRAVRLGHRHPLTIVREQLEDVFARMGFTAVEGPEVEDEWHCFDALNMPSEHPARDMQDTLYLATPITTADGGDTRTLLRTHTSSMQIRYMQSHTPPIRIVVPGRVYRRDDLDLTHSPAFAQIEGLAVG